MDPGQEIQNILGIFDLPISTDVRDIAIIKPIGKVSVNGFVNKLTYGNNDTAILKSTRSDFSDNLYFEWFIGCSFINYLAYPCFCKTYSLCNYLTDQPYNYLLNHRTNLPGTVLYTDVNFIDACNITQPNAIKSCRTPALFGVVLQNIPDPVSFRDFMATQTTVDDLNVTMVQILLQIYIPLGNLETVFTHYDLHDENVLIYTIPNNMYVTLIYNLPDGTIITIKTKYIAKIIDYGRSFFRNGIGGASSNTFFTNNFTNNRITNAECLMQRRRYADGRQIQGYNAIGYPWFFHNRYNINQLSVNRSKDLWLVYIYRTNLQRRNLFTMLEPDLQIMYNNFIQRNDNYPDYLEDTNCKNRNRDSICTVGQFRDALCRYYDNNYASINNKCINMFLRTGTTPYATINIPVAAPPAAVGAQAQAQAPRQAQAQAQAQAPVAPPVAPPVARPAAQAPAAQAPVARPPAQAPAAQAPVARPPVAPPVAQAPVARPVARPPNQFVQQNLFVQGHGQAAPVAQAPVARPVARPPVAPPVAQAPVARPVARPPNQFLQQNLFGQGHPFIAPAQVPVAPPAAQVAAAQVPVAPPPAQVAAAQAPPPVNMYEFAKRRLAKVQGAPAPVAPAPAQTQTQSPAQAEEPMLTQLWREMAPSRTPYNPDYMWEQPLFGKASSGQASSGQASSRRGWFGFGGKRRKTNKRKTNKRKSNKRKSNKRKSNKRG